MESSTVRLTTTGTAVPYSYAQVQIADSALEIYMSAKGWCSSRTSDRDGEGGRGRARAGARDAPATAWASQLDPSVYSVYRNV